MGGARELQLEPMSWQDLWDLIRNWWPVLLGNVLEWYEFAIFAYLSKTMATNFFAGSQLATWAGFSVTFMARPIGGSFLAWVADTCGRRGALLISMLGMLIATVGQGLLPSRLCCGEVAGHFGMVLLLLCRFMQGACAGGEICSIATYCTERAPQSALGFCSSLVCITGSIAFLLASAVTGLCEHNFGPEAMEQWGWRVPFLLSLPPGLVAMWGRRSLVETEEFLH